MRRSNLSRKPRGNVDTKSFPLKGGLNLIDAPLTIPGGMCLAGINYELLTTDGYRRVDGFERFDGQASPTDASYWILNYDGGTVAISEGDTVTGLSSGVTGVALTDYIGTVAEGYLVLTNVTGSYTNDEDLQVSAATVAFANGVALERGATTSADDATHVQDAIETQRALIDKVGEADGSGAVRGVHVYMSNVYAFRDNAASDKCLMWKATTAGWVEQDLGNRIHFTDGGTGVAYVDGEVISGTTSGASATILRVVLQSGAWGTDAVGYFVIGTVTSGPFQAEATTGSVSGAIPIDGAEVAQEMANGGRYEFENYNFFGTTQTKRMYGVNGVSEAFEWDGTVFVPLITGNTVDTPSHLAINEYHLQLVFANGSLQNSDTGLPYKWAGGGAAEIGCGDDIVGLKKEVGGALAIICRNRTFALHGKNTTASPWDLKTVSDESGGIEWTVQRLNSTKYLDDRGFTDFIAVQEFGDFQSSVYSQVIEPLINAKKELAVSSIIVKKKSQVRTFFSDGTAIVATFKDKKLSGFTTVNYIGEAGATVPVLCTANGEDANGSEILFFGSGNGYVYQMDKGTSFDGSAVTATFVLAYNHLGSPSYDKQFKKVIIETDGSAGTQIDYNVILDYSSGRAPAGITNEKVLSASGSLWDAVNWNKFTWSSEDVTRIEGDIDGVGRNIGLQVTSSSTYTEPHTLYGITYNYILRKLVR